MFLKIATAIALIMVTRNIAIGCACCSDVNGGRVIQKHEGELYLDEVELDGGIGTALQSFNGDAEGRNIYRNGPILNVKGHFEGTILEFEFFDDSQSVGYGKVQLEPEYKQVTNDINNFLPADLKVKHPLTKVSVYNEIMYTGTLSVDEAVVKRVGFKFAPDVTLTLYGNGSCFMPENSKGWWLDFQIGEGLNGLGMGQVLKKQQAR